MFYTVGYNGELYIFGGFNARLNRHFHDLWKFDPGIFMKRLSRTDISRASALSSSYTLSLLTPIPVVSVCFVWYVDMMCVCRNVNRGSVSSIW